MDDYEPVKVLGEGSYGKVYLMKSKETKDLVCTKVIKLKNIPKKEQEACRTEVELLKRMIHPNIVGYIENFLYKNCLCIIMEYCDAGDLNERVSGANGVLFTETKIMTWFVQIAMGLHFMHSNRVLHRDIKTQNIFILSSGRVVLGDLGISKVMGGTMDFASTQIGTPYYMSPEIFQNKPYNHKSDVWALGIVLYELATLQHAFDAQSITSLSSKIIKGRYPPIHNDYSNNLKNLIKDLLAPTPKARPDIEQVLRKAFMAKRVEQFVHDLHENASRKPRTNLQIKALESMNGQLEGIGMPHLISGFKDDVKAPDPAKTEDDGEVRSAVPPPPAENHRAKLQAQKHELEVEEERLIAAQMALKRLRHNREERLRRASVSPMSPGAPHPVAAAAPAGEAGAGEGDSPASPGGARGRRPSLLQRLGLAKADSPAPTSPTPDGEKRPSQIVSPTGAGNGGASYDYIKNPIPQKRRSTQSNVPILAAGLAGGAEPAKGGDVVLPQLSSTVTASHVSPRDSKAMEGMSPIRVVRNAAEEQLLLANGGSPVPGARKSDAGGGGGQRGSAGNIPNLQLPAVIIPAVQPRAGAVSARVEDNSEDPKESPRRARSQSPTPTHAADGLASPGRHRASVVRRLSVALAAGADLQVVPGESDVIEAVKAGLINSDDEERDFIDFLRQQAAKHQKNDDEDYEAVRSRERALELQLKTAEERCKALQAQLNSTRNARRKSLGQDPIDESSLPALGININAVPTELSKSMNTNLARAPSYADDDVASEYEDEPNYVESQLPHTEDDAAPEGQIQSRISYIKRRCVDAMGAEVFEKAFGALKRLMNEDDGYYEMDGVTYDGADDTQVEKVLVAIMGKDRLPMLHLMDQLLLLGG